jgi:5-methylcytosine-specific restriction endonuclease McrA
MPIKGKIYGANVQVDLNVCFFCTSPIDEWSRTTDHLIPESRGGIRANKNKVPCCGDCNKLKGDMTPEEFVRALKAMLRLKGREHKRQMSYLKRVLRNTEKIVISKKRKESDE